MGRFRDNGFKILLILTILLFAFSFYFTRFDLVQSAAYFSSKRFPLIVIGILTAEQNVCLRNAQRQLFVTQAMSYTALDIKIFFLLDHPTPLLEQERLVNNDIFYFNSTVHGWNKEFAKKLHSWYRFVAATYPDAMLVGRMDDDVFCCVPQMFDRLVEVQHPLLYYGYQIYVPKKCPTNDCIDDMFVFVGMELVQRIARGHFCVDQNETNCLHDGMGWQKLRDWISPFSNETRFVNDNSKIIFFWDNQKENPNYNVSASARMRDIYNKHGKSFCKKYLLFHKASAKYIYQMNKENALDLGDYRRVDYVDEEMMKADDCVRE